MKRTSSMVYNETAESNELYLFTDNTQQLDGMIQAVKTSLETLVYEYYYIKEVFIHHIGGRATA